MGYNNSIRNAKIIELYLSDEKLIVIAERMGISVGVIAGVINRAGIKNRWNRVKNPAPVGKVYSRLTVLGPDLERGWLFWKVECSCGTLKSVNYQSVIYGYTKSCGCLLEESRYGPRKEIGNNAENRRTT